MANIDRVRVALTGFPGGPGVATMYGLSGPALFPFVVALWGHLAVVMPPDVSIRVEPSGDTINDADGTLTGGWSIAPVTGVVGAAAGAYAAPAGACITWLTSDILDHHRVKGRTFVVPLGLANYEADGTLTSGTATGLATAGAEFVTGTAGNAVVWHRPRKARAATLTLPARVARVGGHAIITGSRVADKVAVLRSRRD